MIERANGRHDRAADLHRRDPCRRLRRTARARARRQARRAARRRRGRRHERLHVQGGDDPDALGRYARRQYRGRGAHDRRSQGRRRRIRADAGNDQHARGQARAAVRNHRRGRRRHLARHAARAGAQARHLYPCRFAGDQDFARPRRQPRLPHRSERRYRRALRQDPYVRRRSRGRRELPRVAHLPARRAGGAVPICPGAGSVSPSATTCASRRSTARSPKPAPPCWRSPPPSPSRPARRIGTC